MPKILNLTMEEKIVKIDKLFKNIGLTPEQKVEKYDKYRERCGSYCKTWASKDDHKKRITEIARAHYARNKEVLNANSRIRLQKKRALVKEALNQKPDSTESLGVSPEKTESTEN